MHDAETSVDRMLSAISAEYDHVRTLIDRLRNTTPDTDRQDLGVLLKSLASNLSAQWQRSVAIQDGATSISVPADLAFEIEQIVREIVSNAVQHGEASRIDLDYALTGELLKLTARDNGRGFPAGSESSVPRSLRERTESLHGSVDLQSEPGSTKLTFDIPLGKMK